MLVINLFPLTDKSPLQTRSLVLDLNVPSTAQDYLRMIQIWTVQYVSLEKEEWWVTRLPDLLRFHPPPYHPEQTAILHLQRTVVKLQAPVYSILPPARGA